MLIIFSVIILIAFVIISLYEKDYKKDKLITKITGLIKILILIPVVFILLFKGLIYFLPTLLDEKSEFFSVIEQNIQFSNHTQKLIIKNDIENRQSFFILNQLENDKWQIEKPMNKFGITYKTMFEKNSDNKIILNADTSKFKKVCLMKLNDSLPVESFIYNIPSNTIVVYSSEKGTDEIPQNISYMKNIENISFILAAFFILIYIIIRNFPVTGWQRIIFFIFNSRKKLF